MSEWYRLCQLQGFCGAGLGQRQIGAVLRRTIARASGMDDRQLRVLQLIRQLRFLFHFITPAIVCLPERKCMYAALLCPQPLHQLRIRRHVAGAIGRIDDHARLCAAGLFDKAHRRIIHRDALPLPGPGNNRLPALIASVTVRSGGVCPWQEMMTWLPWIFWVWSQRSDL